MAMSSVGRNKQASQRQDESPQLWTGAKRFMRRTATLYPDRRSGISKQRNRTSLKAFLLTFHESKVRTTRKHFGHAVHIKRPRFRGFVAQIL